MIVDAKAASLALRGAWTLAELSGLAERLPGVRLEAASHRVDARALESLDTAGALLLVRTLGRTGRTFAEHRLEGATEDQAKLLAIVASSFEAPQPEPSRGPRVVRMLARVGAGVLDLAAQARELVGFLGLTLFALGRILVGRGRLRLTSTVFHMEQTGLDAVPIVALLTFLVGAVVAFLGATVLRDYGASIFTIDLVSYSFLREFGVLLTAILLAGRSGSAFTAQIGSMKSREEIDAIQVLGLDAVELLVVPRLLALLVMLPCLTIVAMLCGLLGGGVVGTAALDISPAMFVSRLRETTELRHFFVGLSKAPVFAFVIALVGCLEGFKVEGSAESVGRRTTSSVVQSIFLVILFDALFAIFFMELKV